MTHNDQTQSIKQAIENLAAKKQIVLSQEAVQAKQEWDKNYGQYAVSPDEATRTKKNLSTVEAFTDSVRLLMTVFRQSRFDDFSVFLAKPKQMITYQFCLGIARGLGFCTAALFVLYLLTIFARDSFFIQLLLS